MKKTLIALLALGSVAMAATKENINTADESLVSYWNFNTANADAKSVINWQDAPKWDEQGHFGILDTGSNHPYTQNAGLRAAAGFTISFDVKDITQVGSILTMATQNGMSQRWRSASMDIAAADDDAYTVSAWFRGDDAPSLTTTVPLTEWTTVTLVTTKGDSNAIVLDFYVEGKHIGQHATTGADAAVGETFNKVQIGYYGDSSKGANFSVDNILVYNRALNAAEVKALIANVPEPTTGALSLLALAGLCIRRRK